MISKRGISGVVTAILLILLAIAAIIIVWAVVKPMIDKAGASGQAECVTINLGIVSAKNIPAGIDPAEQKVVVKREPGVGDLTGITVRIVDEDGDADTVDCPLDTDGLLELDTKLCTISGLDPSIGTWKTVEVYAMVGPQETLCTNFESTNNIATS